MLPWSHTKPDLINYGELNDMIEVKLMKSTNLLPIKIGQHSRACMLARTHLLILTAMN